MTTAVDSRRYDFVLKPFIYLSALTSTITLAVVLYSSMLLTVSAVLAWVSFPLPFVGVDFTWLDWGVRSLYVASAILLTVSICGAFLSGASLTPLGSVVLIAFAVYLYRWTVVQIGEYFRPGIELTFDTIGTQFTDLQTAAIYFTGIALYWLVGVVLALVVINTSN